MPVGKGGAMFHRALLMVSVVLTMTMGAWGCRNTAATHQGKVVEVGAGTLSMTDPAGANQHTHNVASDAIITCDGEPCGLNDLKTGDLVTVTTATQGGVTLATKIEAKKFLAVS